MSPSVCKGNIIISNEDVSCAWFQAFAKNCWIDSWRWNR